MYWKKNRSPNWNLYCIIDGKVIKRKDPLRVALAIFRAGAPFVQLRYKNCPSYKLVSIAKRIEGLAKKYKKTLLVNDRADVALASAAGGVHLGSGDLPIRTARLLLSRKGIVGKTVHTVREAKKTNKEKINYVSAGPVFATQLKKNLKSQGVDFVREISKYIRVPVFAIGGINERNVKKVFKSNADGICVTRALYQGGDVFKNTKTLLKRLEGARRR